MRNRRFVTFLIYSFMLLIFLDLMLFSLVQGSLKILKIGTRMPKPKDIGLIFDITLKNSDEEVSELLKFSIRANGYCCVNVSSEIVMGKMGRIVGGDFGFIQPGAIEKASLIWPTVSLYNRVGYCPIAIISKNFKNEEHTLKKIVKFDTRFEVLDKDKHTLRAHYDFIDCRNWDKDYFKNCTPVDCEERYFGLSYFYNSTLEKCQEMPQYSKKYQLYDIFSNECLDTRLILSEEDLKEFKESKFDNNIWQYKSDFKKHQKNNLDDQPSNDKRFLINALEDLKKQQKWSKENNESKNSAWFHGLGVGLLIVSATIAIYLLICFSVFLFVTWLTRRSSRSEHVRDRGLIITPPHLGSSEENVPIYTTSSLMSQR